MKISAVIITFNEERNIGRCIESIQDVVDEIVVVDSFSTDKTKEICERYNTRFLQHEWIGFGPQKNWGNEQASNDYILSLDADEELSDELKASILSARQKGLQGCYSLDRLNYYYGKFLKHGLEYPDRKPRLFDRRKVQWNHTPVHEELLHTSTPMLLKGYLRHYTYQSIAEHVEKANKYTTLAAQNYLHKGKKPSLIKLLFSPLFTFFKAYILRAGFLDGRHGLVLACLNYYGTFIKYAKHWQLYYYGKKSISLIISTYNWETALRQTLESVKRQILLPLEVIIADDGSSDTTRKMIEEYRQNFPVPLHHVWQPDEGFQLSKIRNKAFAKATGKYIIQIDGDIILHSKFIFDHVKVAKEGYFTNGSRVLLGAKVSAQILACNNSAIPVIKIEKNKINNWRCPWLRNILADHYQSSPKDITMVRGCNMGFWKKDVIAVNGYDEDFVGWGREDSDIAVRLHNSGIKKRRIKFGAIAYHLHHKEADRSKDDANTKRLQQHIEQKLIRCHNGIDKYL